MSTEISVKGDVLTAFLSGEIDHHSASDMRSIIDGAIDINMPSLLVLDFAKVTFMDSSGIGLVMGRYGKLSKTGAKLHISNMPINIYKVMKLAGLDRLASMDKCEH